VVLPTQARRDHEDVVGYSRLMAANEAATVETLKSYRDIITRLVGAPQRPRGQLTRRCTVGRWCAESRTAGLRPADKLKDMPNLIRIKSCDEQRAKITG
jgi:hypothetical protein